MHSTGVIVHMRLSALMAKILVKIDTSNTNFLESDGTLVVELDKALYGCVKAAVLWFEDIEGNF